MTAPVEPAEAVGRTSLLTGVEDVEGIARVDGTAALGALPAEPGVDGATAGSATRSSATRSSATRSSATRSSATLRWLGEERASDGVRQRRFDVERAGRKIPGILWTPADRYGPFPLVLIGHGASGSKRQEVVVHLARRLAGHHQVAAAAIDGPVHGDRRRDPGARSAVVLLEFAQMWAADGEAMTDGMVADWEATLALLDSEPEIRPGPIGWWGVSMGSILGLPVVAGHARDGQGRVAAAVLGLMGLTGPTRSRIERDAPAIRCPVLFLVQWDDEMFRREDAMALFGALGSRDKRLHAHPGGHGALPVEEVDASAAFLAERLSAGA